MLMMMMMMMIYQMRFFLAFFNSNESKSICSSVHSSYMYRVTTIEPCYVDANYSTGPLYGLHNHTM